MGMTDRLVSLYMAQAVTAALLRRARTSLGCAIEIPMFEAAAHFVLVEHMFGQSFAPPAGPATNPRMLEPNRKPFKTKDGYVCVLPYSDKHWLAIFKLLGRPELADDPRYHTFSSRREHIHGLYALLANDLQTRTTTEWMDLLLAADVPCSKANTVEELLTDPHLWSTGFFYRRDGAEYGFTEMAFPANWSDWTPAPGRAAPRISQHTDEVLRNFGFTDTDLEAFRQDGVIG